MDDEYKEGDFMKKRVLTFILILSILFVAGIGGVTVSAKDYSSSNAKTTSPRLINCEECDFTFKVFDPGEAHVLATYSAKADVFTQSKLTVKIQKKILGLFWQSLKINGSSDEWTAYSYAVNEAFSKSFPIDSTGTYRAVFCLEIYVTSGAVETIEDTIEYKYT